jgi:hypothetical protein
VQFPITREEVILRALRVNPCFERKPILLDLALVAREGLSTGHPELPLNQIHACDHLRDGVLHLQPGVHLHEEVLLRSQIENELNRTCVSVLYSSGGVFSFLFLVIYNITKPLLSHVLDCHPDQTEPPRSPSNGDAGSNNPDRTSARSCRASRQTPTLRYAWASGYTSPRARGRP